MDNNTTYYYEIKDRAEGKSIRLKKPWREDHEAWDLLARAVLVEHDSYQRRNVSATEMLLL
jgi:hypothetical protein